MKALAMLAALAATSITTLAGAAAPSAIARAHAERLARQDPWLSELFSARGARSSRADVLDVSFGKTAGAPIAIRLGSLNRALATLFVESGDIGAPIDWAGGIGTYAHAPGITGFWVHAGDVLEQLLLVDRAGESALRWRIELAEDMRGIEREASGALLFVRRDGEALLRIPPPYAIDSQGRRVSLPLAADSRWRGGKLTIDVELDLRSLDTFPVLVDPAIESVIWQQIAVTGTLPPKRWGHGLAYDPTKEKIVLFGGDASPDSADTWTYDGAVWTELSTSTAPPPRSDHAMTYIADPPGILVFGGLGASYLGDTWHLSGTTWSELPGAGPSPRNDVSMTFAPAFDAVVLMGGGASGSENDTWRWQGGWTESTPSAVPVLLAGNVLAYDAYHQTVLSYGGGVGAVTQTNSFWSYDGVSWTALPTSSVKPRRWPAFAFDPDRQLAVLFGGEDPKDLLNDTWEWDAASGTWNERIFFTKPSWRASTPLAYDAKRRRFVLFGGFTPSGLRLNDTWEYRVVAGTCTTTAECDGVPCVDGACCVTSSCGTCSACSAATGACAPLLNADDPDNCTGEKTCDFNAECKLKPGAPCANGGECASGFCSDGVCCNAPCQGACEACDLESSAGVCTLVTGAARHGSCAGSPPCGSTCTGNSPNCTFASPGTPCGGSCQEAALEPQSCDGSGVCVSEAPIACANHFACLDGQSCRTSCSQDEHCQLGYTCRDGACVVPNQSCLDDVTEIDEAGVTKDCTPFACLSGACGKSCSSAAQCAPGYACTADESCVEPAAAEDSDEGCGCRMASRGSEGAAAWLVVLLAAARRCRSRVSPIARSRS